MNKQTTKKFLQKALALALVMVTFVTYFAAPASAATWRTGNIPSNNTNTSSINVFLTDTSKDAKIKIHGYGDLGWPTKNKERNVKLYVTMKTWNNKWIWGGSIWTGSWGKTMTLGNDHDWYKIYLKHEYSIHCWDVGHCCPDYYGIECTKNCSVS